MLKTLVPHGKHPIYSVKVVGNRKGIQLIETMLEKTMSLQPGVVPVLAFIKPSNACQLGKLSNDDNALCYLTVCWYKVAVN